MIMDRLYPVFIISSIQQSAKQILADDVEVRKQYENTLINPDAIIQYAKDALELLGKE